MSTTQYTEKVNAALAFIKASEAALSPLAASARLMKSDLTYGRFCPLDFKAFQHMCRRMAGRTNGLAFFFTLVGVGKGAEIRLGADKSGGDTLPHTPSIHTPKAGPSTKTSMQTMLDDDERKPQISTTIPPSSSLSALPHSTPPSSFLHQRRSQHHDHSNSHNLLHTSLFSLSHPFYDKPNGGREIEHAVGAFESQRYINLEATTRMWDPNWEEWTRKALQILGER